MNKKIINWERINKLLVDSNLYSQKDFKYFCEYCHIYIEEINEIYAYLIERKNMDGFGKEMINKFNLAHLLIVHLSILIEIIANFYYCYNQSYKFKIYTNLFKKRDSKWVMSKDILNDLNIFREVRKLIMHPLGYKNDTKVKKLKVIHHKDKTKKIDISNMKFNSPSPFWEIPPNTYGNDKTTMILLIPVISNTKHQKIIDIFDVASVSCAITDSPSYIMFLERIEDFIYEYVKQCINASDIS